MVEESTAQPNLLSSRVDTNLIEIYPIAQLRKHDNSVDSVANNPKSEV